MHCYDPHLVHIFSDFATSNKVKIEVEMPPGVSRFGMSVRCSLPDTNLVIEMETNNESRKDLRYCMYLFLLLLFSSH